MLGVTGHLCGAPALETLRFEAAHQGPLQPFLTLCRGHSQASLPLEKPSFLLRLRISLNKPPTGTKCIPELVVARVEGDSRFNSFQLSVPAGRH